MIELLISELNAIGLESKQIILVLVIESDDLYVEILLAGTKGLDQLAALDIMVHVVERDLHQTVKCLKLGIIFAFFGVKKLFLSTYSNLCLFLGLIYQIFCCLAKLSSHDFELLEKLVLNDGYTLLFVDIGGP